MYRNFAGQRFGRFRAELAYTESRSSAVACTSFSMAFKRN
jgi:hypothetical protein